MNTIPTSKTFDRHKTGIRQTDRNRILVSFKETK